MRRERAPTELVFKAKVLRGMEQAERGEVIPHSQVKRELEQWRKSIERQNQRRPSRRSQRSP